MTPSDVKATLSFSDNSPSVEMPIYKGTLGPGRDRHPQAVRPDRQVHVRPGLHVDGGVQLGDHLHRRRQGRAAVPRLSDRQTSRDNADFLETCYLLLNGELPNAAAEGRVRRDRHEAHDGARADALLLPRLPSRRAPDGGAGRLRRRAVGVLSRLARTSTIRVTVKCRRFA